MKSKYGMVLFDLDGTLTDSGPGIMASVHFALGKMNLPVPPRSVLRRFVGPPLFTSFTQLCGMTPKQAETAIGYFREAYSESGVYNNSVYPGIPETLESLRKSGARLAVATSKPGSMTKVVLEHFGLLKYFDFVSAADESDKCAGKEELILPVLKKASLAPAQAVMIGDTKFDTAGAENAGTAFLGVLYGFGTEEEMRREGASVFAHTAEEISSLLLS